MDYDVPENIRSLAEKVIAAGANKRAIAVLKVMLDKGFISTDDVQEMGYNHPPRAIGDVRDSGIPIITGTATSSKSGKRMAVYTFGKEADIQNGRIGGRSAFPKSFKRRLIEIYGQIDCITGAKTDERALQIDHRVPYRIAGDQGLSDHDITKYMLLDASSQRSKSWSCEQCPNMEPKARRPEICANCFWASPEKFTHVATLEIRRAEVVWQGDDVSEFDNLSIQAERLGCPISDLIRKAVHEFLEK
jgi:hypothetical protein